MTQSQREVKITDSFLKMIHMLKLQGKDFKIAILSILSEVKKKTLTVNNGHFDREMQNIKMKQMKILEPKNKTSERKI